MKKSDEHAAILLVLLALTTACRDDGRGPVAPRPTRPDGTVDKTDHEIPDSPLPEYAGTDKDVCANVRALACSNGARCEDSLARARSRHTPIPASCFLQARDLATLRGCGDTSTFRFDCP